MLAELNNSRVKLFFLGSNLGEVPVTFLNLIPEKHSCSRILYFLILRLSHPSVYHLKMN